MLAAYRSVLVAPGAARLFASALFGRLPQGMSSLALLLLVRGATGSYAAAGAAVGAYALSSAGSAPWQGRLIDRFGRARVLAPCAAGQAAVLVAVVVAAHLAPAPVLLAVLCGLAGALVPPIAPTVRALLRDLFVDPTVRERAYALESVIQELIWITGPLVVAVVIAAASPTDAVLLLAIVCVGGMALFLRAPHVREVAAVRPRAPEGAALASPELRLLLAPVALNGLALGAVEVGLPALALHAGSKASSGLLLALWSVGSMTGGLWYGSRSWAAPLGDRYRLLLVMAVAATAPLVFVRALGPAVACSLLAGVTIAPVFSCQYALVGRAVRAGTETEAFTWVAAALVGGIAAGSALGGALVGSGGVGGPFLLACAAGAVAAALSGGVRNRAEEAVAGT